MKTLSGILRYIRDKNFIRKYESNPRSYDGPALLANSDYCNAVVDTIIYENS